MVGDADGAIDSCGGADVVTVRSCHTDHVAPVSDKPTTAFAQPWKRGKAPAPA